jgi:hypothetical protein
LTFIVREIPQYSLRSGGTEDSDYINFLPDVVYSVANIFVSRSRPTPASQALGQPRGDGDVSAFQSCAIGTTGVFE